MVKSILSQRCPRCRKGGLFQYPPYDLKRFNVMPDRCDCCGQPFQLEPGFYDGAMYVSYALQVALFTSIVVAYEVLYPEVSTNMLVLTVAFFVVLLLPIILRLSKSVWIHFFVNFDASKQNCERQKDEKKIE